jgi:hypothetical protein
MTNSDTVPGEGHTKGLSELLDKVQAASGPDLELDARIVCAFLPGPSYQSMRDEGYAIADLAEGHPAYTASIDAALALVERVLPGWQWCLNRNGRPMALVNNGPGRQFECDRAPTMPLAILAATLQALIAGSKP